VQIAEILQEPFLPGLATSDSRGPHVRIRPEHERVVFAARLAATPGGGFKHADIANLVWRYSVSGLTAAKESLALHFVEPLGEYFERGPDSAVEARVGNSLATVANPAA